MHFTLPRASASRPQALQVMAPRGNVAAVPLRPKHSLTVSNGVAVSMMRHGLKKAELGLPADQRKALIRSLVTEVLRHGRITTTKTRAKAIRKYVDKMITLAKDGSLHAKRQAFGFVYDKAIVYALFKEAPQRYAERNGGYCRVVAQVNRRRGDNAELATIELV